MVHLQNDSTEESCAIFRDDWFHSTINGEINVKYLSGEFVTQQGGPSASLLHRDREDTQKPLTAAKRLYWVGAKMHNPGQANWSHTELSDTAAGTNRSVPTAH